MSTTLPPFAITWGSGSPQNIVEPDDALKLTGWTGTPAPVYQYFNWWMNYSDGWLTYLRTRGVPDFHTDSNQTSGYRAGDRVQWTDGKTYVALQTFSGAAHTPAESTYFARWGHTDAEVVALSGKAGVLDYNAATAYVAGDRCMYHGGVYECAVGCTNVLPGGTSNWFPRHASIEASSFIPPESTVGSVSDVHGFTVGRFRELCFTVSDVGNPSYYVDLTIPGFTLIRGIHVELIGDWVAGTGTRVDPTASQVIWRVSWGSSNASGSHPKMFVRVTGDYVQPLG